jgi:glycerol-3-phosphate acyltransferase PlsY
VLSLAYLAGAVPFSNLAARWLRGVDLRRVGTGTVSGTGLYRVAGFGPLAVAGSLDVAKGAVGPLLAGRDRPVLAALAGGAAVAGHDWSPFLGFAGGRGISPALGALAVNAPAGVAVLGAGLAAGRLARRTSLGCFVAYLALVPVLRRAHGRRGALAGAAVLVPILAKRLAGNAPPPRGPERARVLWNRLVHDQDEVP